MTYEIPGSNVSPIEQAKAEANATIAALQPSYSEMLETIKSGAIFKDVSEKFNALSNIGVDTSAMAAQFEKAKANMSIDMALANASLMQKAKEAQAAGVELSESTKETAMAPLSVLKNIQSTITDTMKGASDFVEEHATTFAQNLADLTPTQVLNSMGNALNSFKSLIPVPPAEGEPTEDYDNAVAEFNSVPGNLEKKSALEAITSKMVDIGNSVTNSINQMAADAATAKSEIISTLKADAFLSRLTKPIPTIMTGLIDDNLNLNKIDKYAVIKAQEAPPTVSIQKTNDAIRPGTATFIQDIPPSLITPSNATRIWSYELNLLNGERKDAEMAYYSVLGITSEAPTTEEKRTAAYAWFDELLGPDKALIRHQSVAIKQAKPDLADRTPEEIAITEQSAANAAIVKAGPEYTAYLEKYDAFNELNDLYQELYNNWLTINDRFSLSAKLLEKISKYTP